MKERPIIFSCEMVRAILEGRKTQTRRVIKPMPTSNSKYGYITIKTATHCFIWYENGDKKLCPFGSVGDRLWVRESWWHYKALYLEQAGFKGGTITRLENGDPASFHPNDSFTPEDYPRVWKKRPSIHMPRWASRITLEIVNVRAELLQDISEENAISEGMCWEIAKPFCFSDEEYNFDPVLTFWRYWDKLNAKRGFGWDVNPWVWVIEFRVIKL